MLAYISLEEVPEILESSESTRVKPAGGWELTLDYRTYTETTMAGLSLPKVIAHYCICASPAR